jgi:hypothetical protein
VKLDKLKKQLLREVKANPKKGAALGVLCLVALWFWGPLVAGWVSGSKGGSKVAKKKAAATETADGATTSSKKGNKSTDKTAQDAKSEVNSKVAWGTLLEWMRNDPTMASAVRVPIARDPFIMVQPTVISPPQHTDVEETTADSAAAESKPLAAQYSPSPESLGLTLSATVVGGQRSTAMINGRAYVIGKRVLVQSGEARYAYRLTEIHATHIVLHDGRTPHELKIPNSNDSQEVLLAAGSDNPEGELKLNVAPPPEPEQ